MIERLISGGQTGADQAALRAARACGVPTFGYTPKHFMTEHGPAPWLGTEYGLVETKTSDYAVRTRLNVECSDGTIWFGSTDSRGFRCTSDAACLTYESPFFIVKAGETTAADVLAWVEKHSIRILNVAGNRASKAPPGFGDRVERFMVRVLRAGR